MSGRVTMPMSSESNMLSMPISKLSNSGGLLPRPPPDLLTPEVFSILQDKICMEDGSLETIKAISQIHSRFMAISYSEVG